MDEGAFTMRTVRLLMIAMLLSTLLFEANSLKAAPILQEPIVPAAAGFPFSDGFETNTFSSVWSTGTSNNGVVAVDYTYPQASKNHAFIGQRLSSYATASLYLSVNLTGESDVFL